MGAQGAGAIEVEIYDMPTSKVGSFFQGISFPLGLGSVELENGTWVKGFVCDAGVVADSLDITSHRGWRNFIQSN